MGELSSKLLSPAAFIHACVEVWGSEVFEVGCKGVGVVGDVFELLSRTFV